MRRTIVCALLIILAGCTGGGSSLTTAPMPAAGSLSDMRAAATTKTYTVPAGACHITGCANAPLLYGGKQVNTFGYTDGVTYFVNTTTIGKVWFGTRLFNDLTGTFTNTGTTTIGGLTYSVWTLAGKFSGGHDSMKEVFDVRGHSGRGGGITELNAGGTVVTPTVTPPPTPTPPSPTPAPTPTDS